jgi:hypothetical protein
LERAGGNELKETRVFTKISNKVISSQIDNLCLDHGRLVDFKVTTSYKFKNNRPPDPDYIAQLNTQSFILRKNGFTVNSLGIVAILRDWSKLEAMRDQDYPQLQVVSQPIPMWNDEQTLSFLEMRIAAHEAAKATLPECSDTEMWAREDVYAVTKRGAAKAVKLFRGIGADKAAQAYADNLGEKYDVEFRAGDRIRCASYCSVSKFCDQYKSFRDAPCEL